jgi:hypothetical protein
MQCLTRLEKHRIDMELEEKRRAKNMEMKIEERESV